MTVQLLNAGFVLAWCNGGKKSPKENVRLIRTNILGKPVPGFGDHHARVIGGGIGTWCAWLQSNRQNVHR